MWWTNKIQIFPIVDEALIRWQHLNELDLSLMALLPTVSCEAT
jgi:hypothetical protein